MGPSPASLRAATSPSFAGRGGRVLDLSMPILPLEGDRQQLSSLQPGISREDVARGLRFDGRVASKNLQQRESPILGKVTVESYGVGDAQSLHDHEANGIAERIGLVFMGTHQIEGSGFVGLTHALDLVFVALDGVEKSQRARSSAVCSVEQEGVRFDNNHVRGNQLPSLLACLGEE